MARVSAIKWTDSTHSPWWGCTKVGPACDSCYAEALDKRTGGSHWGAGSPRRRVSEKTRNDPLRWNKKAPGFQEAHGRRQRVFTGSMCDVFDNEVPSEWRADHFEVMSNTPLLEWQICTKRVSNLRKMIPFAWEEAWPRNIGVLVTIVTQAEADRDLPRLLEAKRVFGIPWVGVSYEPAQERVNFLPFMILDARTINRYGAALDWIIFGGKSGPQWNDRPFDVAWGRDVRDACSAGECAFFMKQVAALRPTDEMIPSDLLIRQHPRGH